MIAINDYHNVSLLQGLVTEDEYGNRIPAAETVKLDIAGQEITPHFRCIDAHESYWDMSTARSVRRLMPMSEITAYCTNAVRKKSK